MADDNGMEDFTPNERLWEQMLDYVSIQFDTAIKEHPLDCDCSPCVYLRAACAKYYDKQPMPREYKAQSLTLKVFAEINTYLKDEHMDDHQRVTAIRDALDELKDDLADLYGQHPMGL